MTQKLFNQIRLEPVMFQWLIQSVLVALVAYGVINPSDEDLGVTYTLFASVLSFITRAHVTPVAKQRNESMPSPAGPMPASR